jgi:subtilase family serine protease
MSFQIPNSNLFSTGKPGSYFTTSDLIVGTPASDLPDTQTSDIAPDQPLVVQLYLRRNQFNAGNRPDGYIKADKIISLPYRKQLRYLSGLDSRKLKSWYGASDKDVAAVKDYLTRYGASSLSIDKEQRKATFQITYNQFRSAFLDDRPEILMNPSGYVPYYYNPSDFADSYLAASGDQAKKFASAIIGIELYPFGDELLESDDSVNGESDVSNGSYYPTEIADFYNFPSAEATRAGEGVVIGLVGTGGNQFELLNQGNAFNKYLEAQGININTLGKIDSPNDAGAESDYGESSMDYSILRSIAPRADIKVSTNGYPYDCYAELIYDEDVDIISSSYGYFPGPGFDNLNQALHELFLDAVLRRKTVVVAALDQGTGNYFGRVLPNGKSTASFSGGDSAILSVGGTSLPKTSQVDRAKAIDEITGLIDKQLMWNQYRQEMIPIGPSYEVYPSLQGNFSLDDFIGATLVRGAFDNVAGSSGIFDSDTLKMPAYQRRNLGSKWQGVGRRYPDVSALAGGNIANDVETYYKTVNLVDGQPVSFPNGGTSAAAPLLAGLLARITSGLRKSFGKDAITGFVNPYLYEAYNSKRRRKLFIDVPRGSNNASTFDVAENPEEWTGKYVGEVIVRNKDGEKSYLLPLNGTGANGVLDTNLSSTGKGFDAASGLGSINGQALFDGLSQVWSTL